jgi:hypothetical protein
LPPPAFFGDAFLSPMAVLAPCSDGPHARPANENPSAFFPSRASMLTRVATHVISWRWRVAAACGNVT